MEDALSRVVAQAVEDDAVVVRLLPPGRDTAATILHRRETTGESWQIRVHTGTSAT